MKKILTILFCLFTVSLSFCFEINISAGPSFSLLAENGKEGIRDNYLGLATPSVTFDIDFLIFENYGITGDFTIGFPTSGFVSSSYTYNGQKITDKNNIEFSNNSLFFNGAFGIIAKGELTENDRFMTSACISFCEINVNDLQSIFSLGPALKWYYYHYFNHLYLKAGFNAGFQFPINSFVTVNAVKRNINEFSFYCIPAVTFGYRF